MIWHGKTGPAAAKTADTIEIRISSLFSRARPKLLIRKPGKRANLPHCGSALIIRGFGVQVPGGAPVLTWDFTIPGQFCYVRFVSIFAPCWFGFPSGPFLSLPASVPVGEGHVR